MGEIPYRGMPARAGSGRLVLWLGWWWLGNQAEGERNQAEESPAPRVRMTDTPAAGEDSPAAPGMTDTRCGRQPRRGLSRDASAAGYPGFPHSAP